MAKTRSVGALAAVVAAAMMCICEAWAITATHLPSLTSGYLTVTGADMKIKDWSGLPRGRKVVALDLSGVSLTGTPTVVPSDDGIIEWKQEDQKLYARRHSDGLMLIFR